MNTALPSNPQSQAPVSFAPLAAWLMQIVGGLKKALTARVARDRSQGPLADLVWFRLDRLTKRFHLLIARLAAGQPAPPRRLRLQPATSRVRPAPEPGAQHLPRGHFWLYRLLPYEAACQSSLFKVLLADPQTAALLAAAPEAGRILRPLCRMLAIAPQGTLALPSEVGKRDPQPRPLKPVPEVPLTWAQLIARHPVEDPHPPPRTMDWLRPRK